MSKPLAVIGYGPLGAAVAQRLAQAGRDVRVLQRSKPARLPWGASFAACDVRDPESTARALQGSEQVISAIGFPYVSAVWERAWPQAMGSMLSACAASGARLIFADNLYMYGPLKAPHVETLPVVDFGRKPRARPEATRLWQAAHHAGRVRVVAVRSPDFCGPGVTQSVLGAQTLGALARGASAFLLEQPDFPHDVAHVDDFARALIILADAPDDAFGQAWHVPCDQTRTLRELLAIAATAMGRRSRIVVAPPALTRIAGLVAPMLREVDEMRFLFDRPYQVDWSKFAGRFWKNPAKAQQGVAEAARWFLEQAR